MTSTKRVPPGKIKLICPDCGSRYLIPKAKVQGKRFRASCKRCGGRIESFVQEDEGAIKEPQARGRWHVVINGQPEGPMDDFQLEEALLQGKISERTYAWREGKANWNRISVIDELQFLFAEDADKTAYYKQKRSDDFGEITQAGGPKGLKSHSVEDADSSVNDTTGDYAKNVEEDFDQSVEKPTYLQEKSAEDAFDSEQTAYRHVDHHLEENTAEEEVEVSEPQLWNSAKKPVGIPSPGAGSHPSLSDYVPEKPLFSGSPVFSSFEESNGNEAVKEAGVVQLIEHSELIELADELMDEPGVYNDPANMTGIVPPPPIPANLDTPVPHVASPKVNSKKAGAPFWTIGKIIIASTIAFCIVISIVAIIIVNVLKADSEPKQANIETNAKEENSKVAVEIDIEKTNKSIKEKEQADVKEDKKLKNKSTSNEDNKDDLKKDDSAKIEDVKETQKPLKVAPKKPTKIVKKKKSKRSKTKRRRTTRSTVDSVLAAGKTKKRKSSKRTSIATDVLAAGGGTSSTPLTRTEVQRGMSRLKPRVKSCFRGSSGLVTLRAVISSSGKLSGRVIGTFAGSSQARCLEKRLRSVRFRRSPKSSTFNYPYRL